MNDQVIVDTGLEVFSEPEMCGCGKFYTPQYRVRSYIRASYPKAHIGQIMTGKICSQCQGFVFETESPCIVGVALCGKTVINPGSRGRYTGNCEECFRVFNQYRTNSIAGKEVKS